MKTIKSVNPNVRDWQSGYGPMKSVNVTFDDGEGGSANCKPGNEGKLKADLEALIGKPLEGFTLEPSMDKQSGKQRTYNDKLQWNLKQVQQQQGGFRGGGGGGGGKPYVPAFNKTKEGFDLQQESIQRSVALTHAVAFHTAKAEGARVGLVDPEKVVETAGKFLEFLSAKPPASPPSKEDALKDFRSVMEAANATRKVDGFHKLSLEVFAEAVNLRKWENTGFRSISELQEMLGDAKFRRLTRAMDLNPCKFEVEVKREEEA